MEGSNQKFNGPTPPTPPGKDLPATPGGNAMPPMQPKQPAKPNTIQPPKPSPKGPTPTINRPAPLPPPSKLSPPGKAAPKQPPSTLGAEWNIGGNLSQTKPSSQPPTKPPSKLSVPINGAGKGTGDQAKQPSQPVDFSQAPPPTPKANLADVSSVEIRTMKDDVLQAKKVPAAVSTPPSSPNRKNMLNSVSGLPSTRPALQPKPNAMPSTAPLGQSFDMSAKLPASKAGVPDMPPSRMKKRDEVSIPTAKPKKGIGKAIGITFLVIVVIGALAGGAWWWFLGRTPASTPAPAVEDTLTAAEIIPAQASLVMRYDVSDTTQRSAIKQAWSEVTGQTPTLSGLAAGNPTLMLADTATAEFFYVVLPNDPRTYLVIPVDDYTTNLLAEQRTVQVKQMGGWYIIHPISTDGYTTSLTQGSMATNGGLPTTAARPAIQFIADTSFFSTLTGSLPAGDQSNLSDHLLSANFTSDGSKLTFTNNPTGTTPNLASTTGTPSLDPYTNLYASIPGDSHTIWIGNSFSEAAANYAAGQNINTEILQQASNATLLSQLTDPFAFYRRQGDDGIEDIGLVITLPDTLKKTLTIGDSALESSLESLIPAIVGNSATAQLVYSDNTYQGVPLRYINLIGSTQTIDYAVTEDYIIVASSKEGMFKLIDTLQGKAPSVTTAAPWQSLVTDSLATPNSTSLTLKLYQDNVVEKLLPPSNSGLPLQAVIEPFGDKNLIQGNIEVATPGLTGAPTATPTP